MDAWKQWAETSTEDSDAAPIGSPTGTSADPVLPPPNRTRRAQKLVAGFGVLSLLGGATFAVRLFAGPSGNTPIEAVQAMMAAAQQSDVIGMMEQLAPGERNLMIESGVPVLEELKRLDVLAPSMNLTAVDGAAFAFSGQTFAESALRDNIATVKVSGGTVTSSGTVSKLIGGNAKDLLGETSDQAAKTDNFDAATIATVKRDGRWYVSIAYSVAENARISAGKPMPTKEQSVTPLGSDTPEGAIRKMLDSAATLDTRAMIAGLDPDEFGALQDYAPLFLSQVETEAAKIRGKFSLTFPDMQLTSTKTGNLAKVKITKWSMDLKVNSVEGQPARLAIDGDCVTATYTDKTAKRCGAEVSKLPQDIFGEQAEGSFDFNMSTTSNDAAYTVVERNGKWFVAPLRTLMDGLLNNLRKTKPADLKSDAGPFGAVPGFNLFGPLIGTGVLGSMDPQVDGDFGSEVVTELPADTVAPDTVAPDTVAPDSVVADTVAFGTD
jgi:hypothetical protein